MTEARPIACSLEAAALQARLNEIAEAGGSYLLESSRDGSRHLLRFLASDGARRRLEAIVAAETQCCSFLDLKLEERNGELQLTIAAPAEGQAVADELAATFARDGGAGIRTRIHGFGDRAHSR